MIAHTIQLALAPVFVLVAISNLMNVLSTRLSRIVDRARILQSRHPQTSGRDHDIIVAEIRSIDRRIGLNNAAIRLLVASGLSVGLTVAILFLEELVSYPLERVAAAFFMVAIALLMWALTLILRETQVAAEMLRIPREYLDLD